MHITASSAMLVAAAIMFVESAWADVHYNTTTYVGCYSSEGQLSKSDSFTYQSYGHCQEQCIPKSGANPRAVMGLHRGSDCWCGSAVPPESGKVDESECNTPCSGFGSDNCGGSNTYSVYLTGYDNTVGAAAGSSSGSNSGSSSSSISNPPPSSPTGAGSATVSQSPSVITKAGETIVITASGQADATNQASSGGGGGGSNKIGIAVGVVVGVIILCALVGAGVFFIRHRKRKAVEDEYRRNQAINSFVTSDKPHSKGGSISDQRLDPSLAHHRRQSDGSIADEMDFSRRILQVRNPDGV